MSTLRHRLLGLVALAVILGLVGGVPLLLLAIGADPIPHAPSLSAIKSALSAPDDGTLALAAVRLIAWASWAFLTVSILLEVAARARGITVPRLPGLALPQSAARGLVGIAAMLFLAAPLAAQAATAGPAAAAQVATAAPAAAVTSTIDTGRPGPHTASRAPTAETPAANAAKPVREAGAAAGEWKYTVQPGDSLWSIAQQHLGAGTRYREIVHLNHDLLHGRGSFLKPGWVLSVPAATNQGSSPETYTVHRGDTLSQIAQDQLGDASRYPEIAAASRRITQPDGTHLTDPDVIDPGWTLNIPEAAAPKTHRHPGAGDTADRDEPAQPTAPDSAGAPAAPAPPSSSPAASPQPTTRQDQPAPTTRQPVGADQDPEAPAAADDQLDTGDDSNWPVRTGYGVGALLAAGVLTLITTRRRAQQLRRQPGHQLPMPDGTAADVEQELRATADGLSVESVDIALRTLAQDCAVTGAALPVVRAGRLTAEQFDLYLAAPATLPSPWTGTADATVWTLELENTAALQHLDVSGIPAPYPALVTIGHDEEDGHVFLDLEYVGALGIAGSHERTREILAALAIELATSSWADDLQVTIVGAYPELEDALQTGRIRYLPSVGRILDDLTARADQDRAAMAAEHTPDLQHARVTGAVPDAWAPEIVLLAGSITARQRNQLENLVDELPRVALAAITSGVSVGEWALDLDGGDRDDQAVLSPIGLQIRPQRIPAEQYGHILEMAALTGTDDPADEEAAAMPEPTLAQISTITPVDHDRVTADPAAPTADETPASLPAPQRSSGAAEEDATPVADAALVAPPVRTSGQASEPSEDDAAPHPPITANEPDQLQPRPGPEDSQRSAAATDVAVQSVPLPTPLIRVLGPVEMANVGGKVEPTKKARLLEYAAYLALNPGVGHVAIDDAIWPHRKTQDNLNTRNTATSKLRAWVGKNQAGDDYLPRHQAGGGYGFLPAVRTDVDMWNELLEADPLNAATEHLDAALRLVRGRPFEGHHPRNYAWSERIAQRMISEIVDASYELGRRRLMEGRWRAAEEAVVVGLTIEPAQERLWRMRILAAHARPRDFAAKRNSAAVQEAIDRMLTITQELGCDLEPETEALLTALQNPRTEFDELIAKAL